MKIKLLSIKPGKRVWWTDPDNGTCSGWGVIIEAQAPVQLDSVITINKEDGGCVEALPQELHESNDGICQACDGKGWLFSVIEKDGFARNEIERCDACELYANDQAALEAVVETANSQPPLLQFVKRVSDLTHEGEPGDDGKPFDPASEDVIAALNQLILEARQLLGTAEKCDECKETVAYVIGCPDGAEICQDCLDSGQH